MGDAQPALPRRLRSSAGVWGLLAVAALVTTVGLVVWSGQHTPRRQTPVVPDDDPRQTLASPFRNVRPEVQYVSEDTCAQCHPERAATYRRHPMGRSLAPVATVAAVQRYDKAAHNPFDAGGARFLAERLGDQVFHKEFRRDSQGRVFAETREEVQYVIGSGTHNYSYLLERDGYLRQSPVTWYTQKGIWDLSPGFEHGRDFFERPIYPVCLFCHSNYAEHVPDTLNHYQQPVFRGYAIGCQRCHGPGELHVERRARGDTVTGLDDTIVNPRRLPPDLREAVCQQCHLEGVLQVEGRGRHFFDYRPGLPWQPFWSVFVRNEDVPNTTFVSAVEQMYASRCFQASKGAMGCISCHDPHRMPEAEEKVAYYRERCLNCHAKAGCSVPVEARRQRTPADDCLVCHMQSLNSSDITHTAVTDHRILRKPVKEARPPPAPGTLPAGPRPVIHFQRKSLGFEDRDAARDLGVALVDLARVAPDAEERREQVRYGLSLLERAVLTWPDDVPALEARANGLSLLGHQEEALATFEAVLALAPRREHTLVGAAAVARKLGRREAAVAYWQRALEVNPWPIQYRTQLANLYAELQEWPKALTECEAVLRRYPASLEARVLLLGHYVRSGDRTRARAEFDRVMALNPPQPEVLRRWFEGQMR